MKHTIIKPKLILILLSVLGLSLILGQSYFWSKPNKPNLAYAEAQEQTVVLQNGQEVRGETYTGTDDASIGTRLSHDGGLFLANWYGYEGGLLRFNLSMIPPGEVRSATLSLYIKSYSGLVANLKSEGKIDLAIHKVTQANWNDNKADWDTYDGVNKWKTPGGDFDPTPISTFTITTVEAFQDLWVTFDVGKLIQEYINQGTEPNPGMLLKASSKVYPDLTFVHSESSEASLRPKLEITYFSQSPWANAGEDKGIGKNSVVTLDGTGSIDPNEDPKDLIYHWHFLSKPSASNLTDSDIVPNNTTGTNGADKPKFTVDALGDYEIELTVTNSLGLSDKDWVTLTSLDIAPHPRIWLTPEILQTLRERAQAQTPEWAAFKKVVDAYLANNSNPYDEAQYIYTYALAYLITGDERYAARALNIMNENIYTFNLPAGRPGYLGSYYARFYAVWLAVGYDWLYDYLSEEDKVRFYEKMNEWAEFYFYDPSYPGSWAVNDPHGNFFYGRIVGGGLTGIATFGDNPRAKEWIDLVRYEKYESLSKPELVTHHKNGGWIYEGSSYSRGSYAFLFQYFQGLKTAAGENLFRDTNFPEAVIYNVIYNTQPTLDRILPTGAWTGNSTQGWIVDINRTLMLFLAEEFRGSPSSEYAQWYLNHIKRAIKMEDTYNKWQDLLWYDPDAPERDIAELPLSYFDGDGTGYIYSLSDWDKDATWVAFQSDGDQVVHTDHLSQNSFYIYKKNWLAAPANAAGYVGGYTIDYNTILVNDGSKDNGQYNPKRRAPGVIERFEDTGDYVYALGQAADTYNSNDYSVHLLDNYARQIVFLRPDYTIVFDRIRTTNPSYYPKWLLKFVNEPIVSGNLTTEINGEGKMFVKTLSPADFTINKVQGTGWSIHLTDNQRPKQDYLFLNILQATDTSQSEMIATEQIEATSGNMLGAKLEIAVDDIRIVLFSKTEQNQNQVTYTLPETQAFIQHLIADLEPQYTYNIYQDGKKIGEGRAGQAGTLSFTSNPSEGASTFQITQGAYNPPPTITLFSAEPTLGKAPLTVSFQAQAQDENGIKNYSWDFGDTKSSNEQNPTHKYNTAGTYTAKLTVTDTLDAKATKEIVITVTQGDPNDPPVITTLTANPQEGNAPLKVSFSVQATDPDNDQIQSYLWTFGDGQTSNEQNPTHTYSQVKTFTAYVEVVDSKGAQTKSNNLTIKVNEKQWIEDCSIGTRTPRANGLSLENWWSYQRGLIRFDLSEYSQGQKIDFAILSLYIQSYPGLHSDLKSQGKIALGIHKVTQAGWNASKADWNAYDGTNKWKTSGGDFDPTPVASYTINTTEAFSNLWVTFDVTSLIQEYIDAGIEPNAGMLIKASTKVYPILTFSSAESADVTLRPKLEITLKTTLKPNITLSKTADVTTAKTGDIITYIIIYKNTGEGEARNVIITDPIPDGTELVEILDSGVLEGNTAKWTIASLPAEQGGTVRMRVRVK